MKRNTVLKLATLCAVLGLTSFAPAKAEASFWDSTTVSGGFHADYGYNLNRPSVGKTAGNTNGYRLFDNRPNNFNFNVFDFTVANKPADWFGLTVSLDYGRDLASSVNAFTAGAGTNGVAVRQAFMDINAPLGNGLNFRAGRFDSPFSVEGAVRAHNLNNDVTLSRTIAPWTFTGVTGTYDFNDMFSFMFGVVNGWNVAADGNNGKSFIGKITAKPTDAIWFSVGGYTGPDRASREKPQRNFIDVSTGWNAMEGLNVTLSYDWLRDSSLAAMGTKGFADAQGFSGWVDWKAADGFWGLTLRGDYVKDDVAFLANTTNKDGMGVATGGTAGKKIWSGTATTHFFLAEGLDLRFEFRHDQSNQKSFVKGNSTATAKKYQDTLGAALAYAF